ncbi:NADPH:quinone oxidoreductase family protein (plasmid) [Burkholderia sp. FERM BP-3421]|uniref:NADPH:quinone oxidoreductase family protein n=1 Tax=Burkholderia sp. FERM BP-3421 TaxID=1494466 RepID=UPI002362905B|nr:NADPH:quinone oxidoreductase family protein [Burkholderia sp. FERM BP-3421]WDD90197.1 NADPH:quinone oxidoreductase family protein [Burkholderia sp. FERM BP-3421]
MSVRAIVCEAYDGTGSLVVRHLAPPSLAAGEARVAVHASGINFADTLIVEGRYQTRPALPFVPGFEIAGTVVETAPDVTSVSVGDRVMGILAWGGFADEVALPAGNLFRIPASMDFVAAAGFAIAYGTSYGALTWRARLGEGETLLVHGAGSGTGLTAVEVGRARGATVIAVASSAEKREAARRHGAHHVIEAGRDDFRDQVKALTGGRGVDVVYDPVGGAAFDASLRVVAPEGRIVVIGFASGEIPRPPANVLLVKNIDVMGFYWGHYRMNRPAWVRDAFDMLFGWFEAGRLAPQVSQVMDLSRAAEAIELLRARKVAGKVVLSTARA